MRFRLLALVLLAFSVIVPMAGSAAPRRPNDPPGITRHPAPEGFFGIVIRDPFYEYNFDTDQVRRDWIDAQMKSLQPAGVEWVRFEFHANPHTNEPELTQADYAIQQAHRYDIKALMLLSTNLLTGEANTLWNFNDYPVSQEYCKPDLGCGLTPYIEAFLRRALEIADHYRGRVDAYEIFNEQNIYYGLAAARRDRGLSYQDEMDPVRVARVITKFYRLLRERGDNTPVIIGGLHPGRTIQQGCKACGVVEYVHALYQSESFQGYRNANGRWPHDGLAYHPYPVQMALAPDADNDFLYKVPIQLKAVIAALRTYDQQAKLWITEIGTRADPNNQAEKELQADFLRIFYQMMWYNRQDVANVFWFKQEDWADTEEWGLFSIPKTCQVQAGYHEPCRYSGDISTWTAKPSYLIHQDRAVFGFPQMQIYVPIVTRGE